MAKIQPTKQPTAPPVKVDNRVKLFKERYLSKLPWNYLVSPTRPIMSLLVHPGGNAQEEPDDAPRDTGPNGPRAFKMPLLTDLKSQEYNIAEIERLKNEVEDAQRTGKDPATVQTAFKLYKEKENALKTVILKMVFGKEA